MTEDRRCMEENITNAQALSLKELKQCTNLPTSNFNVKPSWPSFGTEVRNFSYRIQLSCVHFNYDLTTPPAPYINLQLPVLVFALRSDFEWYADHRRSLASSPCLPAWFWEMRAVPETCLLNKQAIKVFDRFIRDFRECSPDELTFRGRKSHRNAGLPTDPNERTNEPTNREGCFRNFD